VAARNVRRSGEEKDLVASAGNTTQAEYFAAIDSADKSVRIATRELYCSLQY
jgi:hypothetical protein